MATSTYENGIDLTFWGNDDDIHEIMDLFSDEYRGNRYSVEHVVTDSGCDEWHILDYSYIEHGEPYILILTPSDISHAAVEYVFYDRSDLFPVFMCNGTWSNGCNMTEDVASDIVLRAIANY